MRVRKQKKLGDVLSHFLDSGAFTLWTKAAEYAKENNTDKWAYYDTDDFWSYCDDYAHFVKKYRKGIDLFANVDAIPNPELTWRNQQYLEKKHKIKPVPVVHYKTNLKWLTHYIDRGYELIGLGGLVGSSVKDSCVEWLDKAFELVCNTKDRLPRVKLHGFGITTYSLLIRYPWWSVDSTTWCMIGAFGGILVPHKRKGDFVFSEDPYVTKMSTDSPSKKLLGRHFTTLKGVEKKQVLEWLELIDVPLGKQDKNGEVLEVGVSNCTYTRRVANILFFDRLQKSLPEWPWPFKSQRASRDGFDG